MYWPRKQLSRVNRTVLNIIIFVKHFDFYLIYNTLILRDLEYYICKRTYQNQYGLFVQNTHGKPTALDQLKRTINRVNEYVGYCDCLSVCLVIYIRGLYDCSGPGLALNHITILTCTSYFVVWCLAHAVGWANRGKAFELYSFKL